MTSLPQSSPVEYLYWHVLSGGSSGINGIFYQDCDDVSRHYQKIPEAPFADAIFYFQYRVFYAIFYIMVDERMKHISIIIPLFLIVLIGISGCGVVGGYCG
ncbi:MAG: hypothetical protein CO189_03650, partial [candidate division Zixibacteria bacterium CG_4_9_14_3_um_filter_46_8]